MDYYGDKLPIGVLGHKNFLGLFSAVALIILPFVYQNINTYKKLIYILLFINFVFLVVTESKTAQVAFLVSFIFSYAFMKVKQNAVLKSICIVIPLVYFIISYNIIGVNYSNVIDSFFSLIGKDSTFTGRVDLWGALINIGREHSFIGYGYKSFFVGNMSSWLSAYLPWQASSAHNEYLAVFLELGLIGVILQVLFLISTYKNVFSIKNKYGLFLIILTTFYFLESFTEIHFFETNVLFLFVIIGMTFSYKEEVHKCL